MICTAPMIQLCSCQSVIHWWAEAIVAREIKFSVPSWILMNDKPQLMMLGALKLHCSMCSENLSLWCLARSSSSSWSMSYAEKSHYIESSDHFMLIVPNVAQSILSQMLFFYYLLFIKELLAGLFSSISGYCISLKENILLCPCK